MESWKGGCPKTPLWENDDSWQENANQKKCKKQIEANQCDTEQDYYR